MAISMFSTAIFRSLPTTFDAQQNLLAGLAFAAAFRPGSVNALLSTDRILSPQELERVLDDALRPASPDRFIQNGFAPFPVPTFQLPPVFQIAEQIAEAGFGGAENLRPIKKGSGLSLSGHDEHGGREGVPEASDHGPIDRELVRLQLAFEVSRSARSDAEAEAWKKGIAFLEAKRAFWNAQRLRVQESFGIQRSSFEQDIAKGESILLDRIRRALAGLLAEDDAAASRAHDGLRSPFPSAAELKGEKGNRVTALINHSVGFGDRLTLRDHQIFTIRLFKVLLRRVDELLKDRAFLTDALLRGTVAMPQGGGKTRTMVASFATAIQLGHFDAKRGDKFMVLNHTDQIHGQNMEVMGLLNDYFISKFGRPLKVTEYKADAKDLSGDVVIVSVPSVNSDQRRNRFRKALSDGMRKGAQVRVAALDEVHHADLAQERQDAWNKIVAIIREHSPHCFRLGFTATPTPKDRPFIRIRDLDLMRAGVTPRTVLIKVEGSDLRRIKAPSADHDFSAHELSTTLLEHHDRNRRIFEQIEKHALRWADPSPSGRERLKPTLYFGVDLQHARMMAGDYLQYFGSKGTGLKGRTLRLLGENRGSITQEDINEAIRAYRAKEIDQVAAIVSGETPLKVRNEILEAAKRGEIEAVFSVDLWYEGADLYMFSNLVGSRPTFSRYKKGQERGRVNRRSPTDVTMQGEILSDEPKILFDVIDTYMDFDRALVNYGEVMNVQGYYQAGPGDIFDAVTGTVRNSVDREGADIVRLPFKPKLVPLPEKTPAKTRTIVVPDWARIAERLQTILNESYAGSAEDMAEDLGISEADLERLMGGTGWEQRYDFLRRLATLLYQERDVFVEEYRQSRGASSESVSNADLALVSSAIAVYEQRTGRSADLGFTVEGDAGLGRQRLLVSEYLMTTVRFRMLSEEGMSLLLHALSVYFALEAQRESSRPDEARQAETFHKTLSGRIYELQGWTRDGSNHRGRLREAAREALILKAGGRLSVFHGIEGISKRWASRDLIPLSKWLNGEQPVYGNGYTPKRHYDEIRALLLHLGMTREEINKLILDAVFEEQSEALSANDSWPREAGNSGEKLLLEMRTRVALFSGGRLSVEHGLTGVPNQHPEAVLSSWIRSGHVDFKAVTRREFYTQVRNALVGLGCPAGEANRLVENAVFEAEGWGRSAASTRAQLLLEARRLVAVHFGGRLTIEHGIQGVNDQQSKNAPISLWLNSGQVIFSRKVSPASFYSQVRALLIGLKMPPEKADVLIRNAVYEEQGWLPEDDTPLGALLKAVRAKVAVAYGGRLPAQTGFPGVPQQNWEYVYKEKQFAAAPLTRWIRGDAIEFSKGLTQRQFAEQVRSLCCGLGIELDLVDQVFPKAA